MALDLTSPFDLTISQSVLAMESNDGRFENFSRSVVSLLEGNATVFSTSASWDLGRDGVGAGGARGIYVCVSLRDDIDQKALADLERLRSTTNKIKHIYMCFSQKLSEHRISALEAQLSREIDHAFDITCLGASQLTEAAARDPGLFERHYGAETRSVLKAISEDPSDEMEVAGLRLALIAGCGDNSIEIRSELYAAGLLEALGDGTERTISTCSRALSEHLRLGHLISETVVQTHLERLAKAGLLSTRANLYRITDEGKAKHEKQRLEAAERFLQGRLAIRQSLETSIGERLSEDDFRRIWELLEKRIATYFHMRGSQMVSEISTLLEEDSPKEPEDSITPLSFLHELAESVANTSTNAQRREELKTAIIDLFTDRASGATEWLVRVCASYVACCALGLEHTSSAALTRLFARTSLTLDSDVLLSLLGEGEPEHQGVLTIVSKWKKVGSRVLVAEPVLQEVAYHASIAQHDFQQVRHLLPGTAEDRLRLIENVFVRSFAEHMAKNGAKLSHWGRFIQQYVGRTPHDWSSILSQIGGDFSVEKLPPASLEYENLESEVKRYLLKELEKQGISGKPAKDKASRDAKLYAAMVHFQKISKATDPGATCLLVSSARRLVRTEARFHQSGEQEFVVPISTVLHLLSLLPQVSLSLSAMKTFLFEDRRPGFSSDLERTIVRLVKSSQAVSLPWAKRGVLMRELRDSLISDARREGRVIREDANTYALERLALSDTSKDRTIELLSQALDRVAAPRTLEEQNLSLRKENEELKRRLQEAKNNKPRTRH